MKGETSSDFYIAIQTVENAKNNLNTAFKIKLTHLKDTSKASSNSPYSSLSVNDVYEMFAAADHFTCLLLLRSLKVHTHGTKTMAKMSC